VRVLLLGLAVRPRAHLSAGRWLQRLACSSLLAGWRQVVELMLELPSRLAREGTSHGLA
jgi:hypothetical protein